MVCTHYFLKEASYLDDYYDLFRDYAGAASSYIGTLLDRKDSTNALLWSKTILNTGSVGGPGVDPPLEK